MKFLYALLLVWTMPVFGSVQGASQWFKVDTRSGEFCVLEVRSKYCEGKFGATSGRCATFLYGVDLDVDFEIIMGGGRAVLCWYVNGRAIYDSKFKFNVGTLQPGEHLVVVAESTGGKHTAPFTVNFRMAGEPEVDGFSHIERYTDRVQYLCMNLSVVRLFEGFDQLHQMIGGSGLTVDLLPELSIDEYVDSSDGIYSRTADIGAQKGRKLPNVATVRKVELGKFASASLMGTIDYHDNSVWSDHALQWVGFDHHLGVKISVNATPIFAYPLLDLGLPVPIYLKGQIFGEYSFEGVRQGDGQWYSQINADPLATIEGDLGVGVPGILGAEGFGTCGLILSARLPADPCFVEDFGFRISGGVKAYMCGFERTFWEGERTHWFLGGQKSRRLFAAGVQEPTQFWTLSRRKNAQRSKRLLNATNVRGQNVGDVNCVVSDAGDFLKPQLVTSGEKDYLFYLTDNDKRNEINRSMLVVRESEGKEWRDSRAVCDDGTADYSMSACREGNANILIAWENIKRSLKDTDGFDVAMSSMEIAIAELNVASGNLSSRNITSNECLDYSPVVSSEGDRSVVVWMRNAKSSLIPTDKEPIQIMAMVKRDGSWSSEEVAVSQMDGGCVLSIDAVCVNGSIFVVFVRDMDNDLSTRSDTEVWYCQRGYEGWTSPKQLTDNSHPDVQPQACVDVDGKLCVTWNRLGKLYQNRSLKLNDEHPVEMDRGVCIPEDCKFERNGVGGNFYWNEKGVEGAAVYSARWNPEIGTLSTPICLVEDAQTIRCLSGVSKEDGTVHIAYETVDAVKDSQPIQKMGGASLKTRLIPVKHDLAVVDNGVCVKTENIVLGSRVELAVAVENRGAAAESNVVVAVCVDCDGRIEEVERITTNLESRAQVELSANWTLAKWPTNLTIIAEIDPEKKLQDDDRSNNEGRFVVENKKAAINAVSWFSTGESVRRITARVENSGMTILPKNRWQIEFRRESVDGELIGTDMAGLLPGTNNTYDAGMAWDISKVKFSSNWECVYVNLVIGQELVSSVPIHIMTKHSDLGVALNAEKLTWCVTGDAAWAGEFDSCAADGQHYAKVVNVGSGAEACLMTKVEGPGVISFDFVTALTVPGASLRFYVDDNPIGVWIGGNDWAPFEYDVTGDGAHKLKWCVQCSGAEMKASDYVAVDNVDWAPSLGSVLNSEMEWMTSGDKLWKGVEGDDARKDWASIADLNADEVSVVSTRVYGEGTLTFEWAVSCEADYDWVEFSVDGIVRRYLTGKEDWVKEDVEISGAAWHEVSWTYMKDELDDPLLEGDNYAMLDNVVWTSDDVDPSLVTHSSPVPVPYNDIKKHYSSYLKMSGGDYEKAALQKGLNGYRIWECYVAGLNPENPDSKFRITKIEVDGDEIKIVWEPDLKDARKYTEFGRKELGGTEAWTNMKDVNPAEKNDYKFRKVTVDMP